MTFLFLFFLSKNILAQGEKKELSLQDACNYAMEYNKKIKNARDNIYLSELMKKETCAKGLPQIKGVLDFTSYFDYELKFDFGSDRKKPSLNPSVIDAGDLEILKMIEGMFSSTGEPVVMENQSNAKVQLEQLIFSGQYWVSLEIAELAKDLSKKELIKTELEIKESVSNTYYLILITEHSLKIIKDNIINITSIYEHTSNMYSAGLAEKTDVEQLSINLSQLRNAESSMERNIIMAYDMLKFQLGLDPNNEIVLTQNLDDILRDNDFGMSLLKEFDVDQNVDYRIISRHVDITKKKVDIQKWAYSPVLVGFYSYTEKIKSTGLDMTPNHVAGLNLSIPLFSSGDRQSKLNQRRIELNIAERNKSMVKDQLYLQEHNLKFNLNTAFENYKTQKANVEVAKNVYKSFENKYKQGILSSLDLTQAHGNYLKAESSYTTSVLELLQAKLKLDVLNSGL